MVNLDHSGLAIDGRRCVGLSCRLMALIEDGRTVDGLCTRPCCAPTVVERELLQLVADGLTNREIAARLVVSRETVKKRLEVVREKLHAPNRAAVVAVALRAGLIA